MLQAQTQANKMSKAIYNLKNKWLQPSLQPPTTTNYSKSAPQIFDKRPILRDLQKDANFNTKQTCKKSLSRTTNLNTFMHKKKGFLPPPYDNNTPQTKNPPCTYLQKAKILAGIHEKPPKKSKICAKGTYAQQTHEHQS